MQIPIFPGRRKQVRHVALRKREPRKRWGGVNKESEDMSMLRFGYAGELNGSVVVEVDGQGRIWLGLPLGNGDCQVRQEAVDTEEIRRIEPGHLGRDGEWW